MSHGRVIPFDNQPHRDHRHRDPDATPRGRDRATPAAGAAQDGSPDEEWSVPVRDAGAGRRRTRTAHGEGGAARGETGRGRGAPYDRAAGDRDGTDPDAPESGDTKPNGAEQDGSGLGGRGEGGIAGAVGGLLDQALGRGWERRAARLLAFARRRVAGEYEVDEFGFDPDLNDHVLMATLRPWYERYFRVELRGVDNVPHTGGALLVANHSGTLPLDALMTQLALLDHHPAHRHLRMLAADLVFQMPFVGEFARKSGHTLACAPDAERLLGAGHIVGVWPEGFKGIGKPFSQRYKLQRFGRGGFVSAALRAGVPIVPTAIVGAEEIYPMIGNSRTLARLLGVPYFPLTPTFPWLGPLGAVPLPSKWFIAFGEPIPTDGYDESAADDPMTVFNLTDQVRETIQDTLYRVLLERRSVFF